MPQIEGLYATVKPLKYSIILLPHFAWATASQNLKYSKVVTPNITVSVINMTLATANSMINMTLATANLDTFKLLTAKMFFWYSHLPLWSTQLLQFC